MLETRGEGRRARMTRPPVNILRFDRSVYGI